MPSDPFDAAEQITYEDWVTTEITTQATANGDEITDLYIGFWLKDNTHLIYDKYIEIKGL